MLLGLKKPELHTAPFYKPTEIKQENLEFLPASFRRETKAALLYVIFKFYSYIVNRVSVRQWSLNFAN